MQLARHRPGSVVLALGPSFAGSGLSGRGAYWVLVLGVRAYRFLGFWLGVV